MKKVSLWLAITVLVSCVSSACGDKKFTKCSDAKSSADCGNKAKFEGKVNCTWIPEGSDRNVGTCVDA